MNFKSALEVIGGVGDEGLGCVTQLLSETPASKRVSILLSFFPSFFYPLSLSPFFLPFLSFSLSKRNHLKLKADPAATPSPHLP